MSAFWNFIASVRDDVRHKVVEEGWYGHQVTGDTVSQTEQEGPVEERNHPLHDQTWGKAATHADIYGQAPPSWGQAPDSTPAEPAAPEPAAGHAPEP